MNTLLEKTRGELLTKSQNAQATKSYKSTRYDRRTKQHVIDSVETFNSVDMNSFFKGDILLLKIPVQGETNRYEVDVVFDGICKDIQRELKKVSYQFEYKIVYKAIIRAINNQNIYIGCTCLHPDTKIKLLDGTVPTILEMKERFDRGEKLYVYSTDEHGDFKPGEVENVFITKSETEFVKITLDNDKEIITTKDHPYMMRDCSYREAQDLRVGDSLMPMYFNYVNEYEQLKLNSEVRGWRSTYKLVAENLYENEIQQKIKQSQDDKASGFDKMSYDVAIHHKDFNKSNNNPENLQVMTGYEHWMYHADAIKRLWDDPDFVKETSERSSKWMTYLNEHPTEAMKESRKEWSDKGHAYWRTAEGRQEKSDLMKEIQKWREYKSPEEVDEICSRISTNEWKESIGEGNKLAWSNYTVEEYENRCRIISEVQNRPEIKEANSKRMSSTWESNYDEMCKKASENAKKAWATPEKKLETMRKRVGKIIQKIIDSGEAPSSETYYKYRGHVDPRWEKYFSSWGELSNYFNINHKVKSIEIISLESTPVYDITIKDWHNFVVDAGVVLHNCSDWKYRFAYHATKNKFNAGKAQVVPANQTNPNDDQGAACKHVLNVLANLDWALKLATTVYNYIQFMDINMHDKYEKIIFPIIYGMPYEAALKKGIVGEPEIEDEEPIDDIEEVPEEPLEEPEEDTTDEVV